MARLSRKRTLLMVLLLLTGGAIINVAVAWGCSFDSTTMRVEGSASELLADELNAFFDGDLMVRDASSSDLQILIDLYPSLSAGFAIPDGRQIGISRTFGCDSWIVRKWRGMSGSGIGTSAVAAGSKCGWPLRSLHGAQWIGSQWRWRRMNSFGFTLGSVLPTATFENDRHRFIPFEPLWPGFAINTIFYAAILWLLFYGPGKVRRFVRVRRGRCPACGFIIAPNTCANGLCSECGATLPRQMVDAAT